MNQDFGNPMLDHLLARMIFNITRQMGTGIMVLFILPDASGVEFCGEQLEAIERDECLVPKIRRIHVIGNGPDQQAEMRSIRVSAIEQDLVDVILMHKAPGISVEYHVYYSIILNGHGEIMIEKPRNGITTDVFIPHENFGETLTHV